jgi:hypothetical protein
VTFTVNETVCPVTPALTVPMFQVTTPATLVPPAVADTKVVPAGTGSRITTPFAAAAPVLP